MNTAFNEIIFFTVVLLFAECPVMILLYYWGRRLSLKIRRKKQNIEDNERHLGILVLTVLFIVFVMVFVGIDAYKLILG